MDIKAFLSGWSNSKKKRREIVRLLTKLQLHYNINISKLILVIERSASLGRLSLMARIKASDESPKWRRLASCCSSIINWAFSLACSSNRDSVALRQIIIFESASPLIIRSSFDETKIKYCN